MRRLFVDSKAWPHITQVDKGKIPNFSSLMPNKILSLTSIQEKAPTFGRKFEPQQKLKGYDRELIELNK